MDVTNGRFTRFGSEIFNFLFRIFFNFCFSPGGGMPFQQQPSYPSYPSNPGYPVPGAGYPAPAGYNPNFGVHQRQVQAVPPFQPDNHQLQADILSNSF